MKLINSKKIIECNEIEEQVHYKEINKIYSKLCNLPNINCALIITDILDQKPKYEICKMHDVFDFIEYFDFKNGIDIYQDNDFITFVLNGTTFVKDGKLNIFLTYVKILPLDANGNVISIYIEDFI